jgi:hypothetical protein
MTTFRVGQVFPATPANTALIQLWIATRHILVLQRALLAKSGPSHIEHEQFLHTFLAITATTKEASDAFRLADSLRCFQTLPQDFDTQLILARTECNENDQNSIYKRLLVRLRNTVGAHFGHTPIQRGLSELKTESFPLRVGGGSFYESTFPLATSLVEKILEAHGVTASDAAHEFPAVINLSSALQKLADAIVTDRVFSSLIE